MLEKMGEFFDNKLDAYEEHQLTCIESAREFYPFTASCLPRSPGARVLDLGCGTGLELGFYFEIAPAACVTGIDLAPGMLEALRSKFFGKSLTLVLGSYFDVPFDENAYDAAVSVESLHHFSKEEKIPLYTKLRKSLKNGGAFKITVAHYFTPKNRFINKKGIMPDIVKEMDVTKAGRPGDVQLKAAVDYLTGK